MAVEVRRERNTGVWIAVAIAALIAIIALFFFMAQSNQAQSPVAETELAPVTQDIAGATGDAARSAQEAAQDAAASAASASAAAAQSAEDAARDAAARVRDDPPPGVTITAPGPGDSEITARVPAER